MSSSSFVKVEGGLLSLEECYIHCNTMKSKLIRSGKIRGSNTSDLQQTFSVWYANHAKGIVSAQISFAVPIEVQQIQV